MISRYVPYINAQLATSAYTFEKPSSYLLWLKYFIFVSACSNSTYGLRCQEACQCGNFGCNHVTGECICSPGYTEPDCDQRKYLML